MILDVSFNILNKKGKLSEQDKLEKKRLQRKIKRQSDLDEMYVINSKLCEIINGVYLKQVKRSLMTSYL